jgi:hypothetical protein
MSRSVAKQSRLSWVREQLDRERPGRGKPGSGVETFIDKHLGEYLNRVEIDVSAIGRRMLRDDIHGLNAEDSADLDQQRFSWATRDREGNESMRSATRKQLRAAGAFEAMVNNYLRRVGTSVATITLVARQIERNAMGLTGSEFRALKAAAPWEWDGFRPLLLEYIGAEFAKAAELSETGTS